MSSHDARSSPTRSPSVRVARQRFLSAAFAAAVTAAVACGGGGHPGAEWASAAYAVLNDWSEATQALAPVPRSLPIEEQVEGAADHYLDLANAARRAALALEDVDPFDGAKSYHDTLIAYTSGLVLTYDQLAREAHAALTAADLVAIQSKAELVVRVQSSEAFVVGHRNLSQPAAEAFANTAACERWHPDSGAFD